MNPDTHALTDGDLCRKVAPILHKVREQARTRPPSRLERRRLYARAPRNVSRLYWDSWCAMQLAKWRTKSAK